MSIAVSMFWGCRNKTIFDPARLGFGARAMTKTLKLHIGQHKTGTSFLQSVLALSTEALAAVGILYPTDKSTSRAASGGVSFGNWPSFMALLETPDLLDQMAEPVVLFSSEGFCENLPEPDFLDHFQRLVADDRIRAVEVLLYIRDPVAYAISYAQQLTKRAGMGLLEAEAIFAQVSGPAAARSVMQVLDTVPKGRLTVLNYSVVRSRLTDSFADWLGFDAAALTVPPQGVVNRSMTPSEVMLIAAVNRGMEKASMTLADALVNRLPDVTAQHLRPSLDAQNSYWDRIAPDVDWINARVPPDQAYLRPRDLGPPVSPADSAGFSSAQIEVIGDVLASALAEVQMLRLTLTDLRKRGATQREKIAELKETLARRRI